jgi:predicted PurR-regulated permease PerM
MSEQAQVHPRNEVGSKQRNWPQLAMGIGVIIAFCYFAEWELAVLSISILIAFILAPLVDLLQRLRLPRGVASLLAVLLLVGAVYAVMYFSYNEAMSFVDNLPKYTSKIRSVLIHVRQSAERLQKTTENVLETGKEGNSTASAQTSADQSMWSNMLFRGFGSFSQAILPISFVPFLVYFMLTWEQHARSATVMLFSMENRHAAYTTLGLISAMIRSFLVGNFLVGVFIAGVSTTVFGFMHMPSFFVVGVVSGFLSLIPYLGVLLAMVVPLVVGLGQLGTTELLIVVATVVALHLFGINVLYPKFLGSRLQLNPLAVTIALLFWGKLWGGMGLVLAIPITGAMKIIFDHVESLQAYGTWLGE